MAKKEISGLKKASPGKTSPALGTAAVRSGRAVQGSDVPPTVQFDPSPVFARLVTGKTRRDYRVGEAVFSQGELADSVFYIGEGKVKLTVVSQAGKEAVVAILPEGSFFGEGCLAGQSVRMATATTVAASTITRVEKSVMVRLLHREPEFAERFLSH